MNRIDRIFRDLRARNAKALMPFVCGGFPGIESTGPVLAALERAGASIIEVGIPFSDPIADGPVIAAAMHTALTRGVTPEAIFERVGSARAGLSVGLIAMVSVSIVHRMGPAAFAKRATHAGFDGVILPDVPLEEAEAALAPMREAGLSVSLLIAPNTPADRAEKIARACSGFVYLMARMGITGTGDRLDAAPLAGRIRALREVTDLPIACGFGVSNAEHVRAVVSAPPAGAGADAAIVGSALVREMTDAPDPVDVAGSMVRGLAAGLS